MYAVKYNVISGMTSVMYKYDVIFVLYIVFLFWIDFNNQV